MFGGKYLNNWHMAELHAKEAPDRVRELEQWGGIFDRTPDRKMAQRAFGGHTYRRLVHIGDRTGLELIRTLQDKAVHAGIDVFMECTITRLLKDGDRVCGAFGYRRATGEFLVFAAPAVVLATGGAGKCWRITSNSWECTGDGHALAYEAGAELVDMEFVQFHPTGMVWPPGVIGLLVTEAVRGEGGILRNADGERFMERYDPKRLELSTRDVVARAIYTEVKEGRGTPHGGVFLDVSHLPAATVRRKLPSMYDQFMELAGVDITREPMEVGPTCHYFMGGIRVDAETGASTVAGTVRDRRVLGRDERRQPAGRQLALGPARVRKPRRRECGASTPPTAPARADRRRAARGRRCRDDALPVGTGRRGSLSTSCRAAGDDAARTSGSSATRRG